MDYHNYRDMDIEDFIPSVNELTERGYFAFRMGKKVQEKLKIDNVKFFDYANKFRTDFLRHFFMCKMQVLYQWECRFGFSPCDCLSTSNSDSEYGTHFVNSWLE